MSLLTASRECEFYKLSFLEGGGCCGEHINYKYEFLESSRSRYGTL